jgi:hypothetical protein
MRYGPHETHPVQKKNVLVFLGASNYSQCLLGAPPPSTVALQAQTYTHVIKGHSFLLGENLMHVCPVVNSMTSTSDTDTVQPAVLILSSPNASIRMVRFMKNTSPGFESAGNGFTELLERAKAMQGTIASCTCTLFVAFVCGLLAGGDGSAARLVHGVLLSFPMVSQRRVMWPLRYQPRPPPRPRPRYCRPVPPSRRRYRPIRSRVFCAFPRTAPPPRPRRRRRRRPLRLGGARLPYL